MKKVARDPFNALMSAALVAFSCALLGCSSNERITPADAKSFSEGRSQLGLIRDGWSNGSKLVIDEEAGFNAYIKSNDAGEYKVLFESGPSSLHALEMSPERREALLDHGEWLVVAFAVWSEEDVTMMCRAAKCAEIVGENINIGVRPFVKYEDIQNWCPECELDSDAYDTPQWLIYRDGKLMGRRGGEMTADQIIAFLRGAGLNVPERSN